MFLLVCTNAIGMAASDLMWHKYDHSNRLQAKSYLSDQVKYNTLYTYDSNGNLITDQTNADPNLLFNPDFEGVKQGSYVADGWQSYDSGLTAYSPASYRNTDDTVVYAGAYSQKLEVIGLAAGNPFGVVQSVNVKADQAYTLSARLHVGMLNKAQVKLYVEFYPNSSAVPLTRIDVTSPQIATNAFVESIKSNIVPPPQATSAKVFVVIQATEQNGQGTIWIDSMIFGKPGPDLVSPTKPGSLEVLNVGTNEVMLAWPKSTDNYGVSGYEVYQGLDRIDVVASDSNTSPSIQYAINNLKPATHYEFSVRALDSSGNKSRFSPPLNVLTSPDLIAPQPPSNIEVQGTTESSIRLSWTAPADQDVKGYFIYGKRTADATISLIGSTPYTNWAWIEPVANQSYDFYVKAFDSSSNVSIPSVWKSNVTAVNSLLSPPANVYASAVSETTVMLSWGKSPHHNRLTSYKIEHLKADGTVVEVGNPGPIYDNQGTQSYEIRNLKPATSYMFTIRAIEGLSNSSVSLSMTNPVMTLSDVVAPTIPADLHSPMYEIKYPNANEPLMGLASVSLSWEPSTDQVGVQGYQISVSKPDGTSFVHTTVEASGVIINLIPGQTYVFRVRAFDGTQYSPYSNSISVSAMPDTQAPTVPVVEVLAKGSDWIGLAWLPVSDNVGIAYYKVTRTDATGVTLIAKTNETSIIDLGRDFYNGERSGAGLSPNTSYTYTVTAYDEAGNAATSIPMVATTRTGLSNEDSTPPTVPVYIQLTSISRTSVTAAWGSSQDQNAITYDVYINGILAGATTDNLYTIHGLQAGNLYSLVLRARDAAGNKSEFSQPISFTTEADQRVSVYYKPSWNSAMTYIHYRPADGSWTTAPGQLMGIAEGVPGFQYVTLNIGGSTTMTAAFTNGNGIWDNNNNLDYTFVPGVYTLVNGTIFSGLPDLQPPSDSTFIRILSQNATSIELAWEASEDNSGIAKYEVYRNLVKVGETTTERFTDSNVVTGSSYTYQIIAVDVQGNRSSGTAATYHVTASNVVKIYYKRTYFTSPYIHYQRPDGSWTVPGGVLMSDVDYGLPEDSSQAYPGYSRAGTSIGSMTQLQFVFHNGSGTWDNNNGANYLIPAGTWTYIPGMNPWTPGTFIAGVPDVTAPSAPILIPTIERGTATAELIWLASTDDREVAGYEIYRNQVLVDTLPAAQTVYQVNNITAATTFTVRARDSFGNLSSWSNGLTLSPLPDTESPSVPTQVVYMEGSRSSVTLRWAVATDNVAVSFYKIYRNGMFVGTSTSPTFTDTGLVNDTLYEYMIRAVDGAGNVSSESFPIQARTANWVKLYYKRGFGTPYLHYSVGGGAWTSVPGVAMTADSGYAGYSVMSINMGQATQLEFVFNNGNGTWDNNNWQNYKVGAGVYTFIPAADQTSPGTLSIGAPNTTNKVTIYYKRGFAAPNIHYKVNGYWTSVPGISMASSTYSGYNEVTIELGSSAQLEFVFNDGYGTWDNNNSANYFRSAGIWTFTPGWNNTSPGSFKAGTP